MSERVKSLVIASLDDVALGDYGDELPLHITVVPPFTHERIRTREVSRVIEEQLRPVEPFVVVGGEKAMFGDHDDIPVRKVGSAALHVVHNLLVPALQQLSHVDINTRWALEKYNPHSTFIADRGLDDGAEVQVAKLYLAQRMKLKDMPKAWFIANEFRLGEGA